MPSVEWADHFFSIAAETVLLVWFAHRSLERKAHPAATTTLLTGLQFSRRILVGKIGFVSLLPSFALDLAVLLGCFRGKAKKKVFLLILFYAYLILFDLAAILLLTTVVNGLSSTPVSTDDLLTPAMITSKLMMAGWVLTVRDSMKTVLSGWLYFVPVPVLTVLAIAWVNPLTDETGNATITSLLTMICMFSLVANTFMLLSIKRSSEKAALSERLRLTEENKSLRKKHIQSLQDAYRHAERASHDLRHHLSRLRSAPDLESVRRYIDEINGRIFSELFNYTGNYDIDTMLNACKPDTPDITLTISGLLPPVIDWLDPVDVSILLGNALENAVEACRHCHGGVITASFNYNDDGWLVFTVENPTDQELFIPKRHGIGFISTKDKPGHGLGIESMELAVTRYDGHIDCTGSNGIFRLVVMLQCGSEDREDG